MSKSDCELITELKAVLISHQYSLVVVENYCVYARGFLDHLARRNILVTDVTEAQVERYLRDSVALFRQRHSVRRHSRADFLCSVKGCTPIAFGKSSNLQPDSTSYDFDRITGVLVDRCSHVHKRRCYLNFLAAQSM